MMKMLASLLLCASLIALSANAQAAVTQNGNVTVVDDGLNHVEFAKIADVYGDFRVYGINLFDANTKKTPLGYGDGLIGVVALNRARQIFAESGARKCEVAAAKETLHYLVIFANDDVRTKITNLQAEPQNPSKHFSLRITGIYTHKTSDFFKGQSMAGMKSTNGDQTMDYALVITDVAVVPWDASQTVASASTSAPASAASPVSKPAEKDDW